MTDPLDPSIPAPPPDHAPPAPYDDVTLSASVDTVSVSVPVSALKALLERAEFDVIGKAHEVYDDIKKLVAEAEAAL